jgi:hypothetical protein
MRKTVIDDLEYVAYELARHHPRFRLITIRRLVQRTAEAYSDHPRDLMIGAVRVAAAEQLRYADSAPSVPVCGGRPVRQRRPGSGPDAG